MTSRAASTRIGYLADHVHHLPALAEWHQAQFGYLNPAVTLAQRLQRLMASAQKGCLPMTCVALSGDQLLGSASLLPHTITHSHLSPWLSSVYVSPEYRGLGVGSALAQHMAQEACAMGIQTTYLFTPHSEALYASLGWRVLEHAAFQGRRITIMAR